jgi:hypothetical protein
VRYRPIRQRFEAMLSCTEVLITHHAFVRQEAIAVSQDASTVPQKNNTPHTVVSRCEESENYDELLISRSCEYQVDLLPDVSFS